MASAIKMARVYVNETDKSNSHNLMSTIVRRLHDEHSVSGVTVYRGVVGFGAHGEVHSADLLRLQADLPLVIEFFDVPETVDATLEWLCDMVRPGRIVIWPAMLV